MTEINLGLFGAGISRSRAPKLHELAGELCGFKVSYQLFDLNHIGLENFESELWSKAAMGFAGVNVTHPIKERASRLVDVPIKAMQQIGSINTIRFAETRAESKGYNTDYSGFMKAYGKRFGSVSPGKVLIMGAGGVGKAIAFGLAKLDAHTQIILIDQDIPKALKLAQELRQAEINCEVHPLDSLAEHVRVDGLINCTPLGMYQYPGSAIAKELFCGESWGQHWAFDAVYTPIGTEFLNAAKAAGLETLSGYELFFYQGVDAFEIFTGLQVDELALRQALAKLDAP
ncbi:MAG: shikimate dehydrogenase [Deinococcales bacterium]